MLKGIKDYWLLVSTLLLSLISSVSMATNIIKLSVHGVIGPATADYLIHGIESARGSDIILIEMDTPGGLIKSTRKIADALFASSVPVVSYVAPAGAHVAKEGLFLLYASTVAAMMPDTYLGNLNSGKSNTKPNMPMVKRVNKYSADLRSIAASRGHNSMHVDPLIRNTMMLNADEAQKVGVVNFVVNDKSELLKKLNGYYISQNGKAKKLLIEDTNFLVMEPTWHTQFLQMITKPTVAYLLFLLGVYGLLFELMIPGVVLPGVMGSILMCIAVYAFYFLPINYVGVSLIIVGLVFITAETVTPYFWALSLGGTLTFLAGSILLLNTDYQYYHIDKMIILGMAVLNIVVFNALLGWAIKSKNSPVKPGMSLLMGAHGRTVSDVNFEGQAVIHGETWNVYANQPIEKDCSIHVTGVDLKGLKLEVGEDATIIDGLGGVQQ